MERPIRCVDIRQDWRSSRPNHSAYTASCTLRRFIALVKHFCKLLLPIDCNQCAPPLTGPTPHPFHPPAAPRDNEEWKMRPNHLSLSMIAISETCFMYFECYQKLWDMIRKYLTLFWAVRDEGVHCASVSPHCPPTHHLSALQPILTFSGSP